MSKLYRYQCSVEGTIVYEHRVSTASAPTTCINGDGGSIVAGTLCLVETPLSVEELLVNSTGRVDFNNCALLDISHSALSDIGTNTHAQIDSHIGNASLHRQINDATTSSTATWSSAKVSSTLGAHTGDASIHFTEASIVHQNISGAGTNTHTQIDSHIASTGAHGVTGTIVGTGGAQTLTGKSISATTNTLTNIDNACIKSGAAIDATKIASGTVSNTVFGYLAGTTSALQTQLNTKLTGASNLSGGDQSLFDSISGTTLQFKSLKQGNNVTLESDGNTVTIHSAADGVIGSYFQTEANTSTTTTTSSSMVLRQKMITASSLPSGTYRVELLVLHGGSTTSLTVGVQLKVNNSTLLLNGETLATKTIDISSVQRQVYHAVDYYTGSGTLTLDLNYSRYVGSGTAKIYYSRITIWRVA